MELASNVQDTTEALKNLGTLVETVIALLQTPEGWVLITGLFVWLILNKDISHLFDFFERGEKNKLARIDEYISKAELSDAEMMKVIRDSRDAHYFKFTTGIYAEKRVRDALINLHASLSNEMTWTHIRRAFPYIKIDSTGKVTVHISWFEKLSYGYNAVVGYGSLLLSAAVFIFFVFSRKDAYTIGWGLGGTVAALLFSLFVFSQNWPVNAAKRINTKLLKLAENKANASQLGHTERSITVMNSDG